MEHEAEPSRPLRIIGRYALYGKLATGGMATVHFGRLLGPVGFSRTVAIKRLHPQFAKDPEFVAMFLDEARLAARVQHPNVVATLDVVARDEELFLVMDYIRGESFSRLLRAARRKNLQLPEGFVTTILAGMLHGLHAAHEATDERGQPLHVVHRDVSPQNVLVGVDGVPRVLDFGVAKAAARAQVTRDGQMKGKLSYMSPEQLSGTGVDRRSDVFAAGVVLWEALTGQRLFVGEDATAILTKIVKEPALPPSQVNPLVRPELDALVLRALEKDASLRYPTAREFAIALERNTPMLSSREIGEWVEQIAGDSLEGREKALAEIEAAEGDQTTGSSDMDAARGMGRALRSARWERDSAAKASEEEPPTGIFHGSGTLQDPPLFHGNADGPLLPQGDGRRQVTIPPAGIRQRRWLFGAAGIALLLGALAWGLWGNSGTGNPRSGTSGAGSQAKGSSSASVAKAALSSAAAAASASAAAALRGVPSAGTEGSGQGVPATSVSARGYRKPVAPVVPRAPQVQERPKANPCAQPWFVDANGIRRVKPTCL